MAASAASQKVGDVLGTINRLWSLGGGISTSGAIAQANAFSSTAQTVVYEPPTYVSPDLIQQDSGTAPTVSNVAASVSLASFAPRSIDGEFESGTADAPVIGEVTIPDAPTAGDLPTVPARPTTTGISVEAAPLIDVTVADAPDIPALPELPALATGDVPVQSLADLTLPTMDDAEIDAALSRLRGSVTSVAVPGYTKLLPEVFDAAGGLLAGDFVVDVDALFKQVIQRTDDARRTHDTLLNTLWSGRGFEDEETVVPEYNTVMRARFEAQRDTLNDAARVRWANDLIGAAYSVGAMAHAMAMDMELALYDAEFDALTAYAEARLEFAKAMIARYNADVLMVGASAEQYAGELAGVNARAARYKAQAQIVETTAQFNSATADAFAATERAKGADADAYRARLSANDAAIKALRSRNEALASQAEAAAVELEAYKAEVLGWTGEVERAKSAYAVFSARARGAIAQNRAEASKAQLFSARNEAVAAQAQQSAAQASASAARAVATATNQGAQYASTELRNAVEAIKARLGAGSYQRAVMQWTAGVDAKAGALEGWASAGAAAVRFSVAAAEAAGRAAQLTQDVSAKIANAHATVLEAAGRAQASIEAGRYAGFRASAVLSASGGFGESIDRDTTTSNETEFNTSYLDRYTL